MFLHDACVSVERVPAYQDRLSWHEVEHKVVRRRGKVNREYSTPKCEQTESIYGRLKWEHALPEPAMVAPQMVANSSRQIVYSEILSVTSIMRKHSRWSSSTQTFHAEDSVDTSLNHLGIRRLDTSGNAGLQQGSREEVLMSGFEQLKRTLRSTQDVSASIPLTDILSPFLSIVRSPLSISPVTSSALSAIHSFFARGLFLLDDPSIDVALAEISSAVSHCTFEAGDSSDEEVVFLRILAVIEDCMCGSWSHRLGDNEAFEMLETVLATCVQMRLSEVLRRSAEFTMHRLVGTVFSKLHDLDPDSEEKKLSCTPPLGTDQLSGDIAIASQPGTTGKSKKKKKEASYSHRTGSGQMCPG